MEKKKKKKLELVLLMWACRTRANRGDEENKEGNTCEIAVRRW